MILMSRPPAPAPHAVPWHRVSAAVIRLRRICTKQSFVRPPAGRAGGGGGGRESKTINAGHLYIMFLKSVGDMNKLRGSGR